KQHSIADFDVEWVQFAVLAPRTRTGGNDFAFHWLFLGSIRDDDSALGLLLLLDASDQNAILQRSKFHWVLPSLKHLKVHGWSVRHSFGKRMECDVRGFKLLRAGLPTHLIPIGSVYPDS